MKSTDNELTRTACTTVAALHLKCASQLQSLIGRSTAPPARQEDEILIRRWILAGAAWTAQAEDILLEPAELNAMQEKIEAEIEAAIAAGTP